MVYQTVVGGLVGAVVVGTSSVRCADVDTAWRSGRTKATCSFIAEVGFGWCVESCCSELLWRPHRFR